MKLLIILSSLILSACCHPQVQPKPPKFDSYLTSRCEFNKLGDKSLNSWEDVLAEKAKNNADFIKCMEKDSALINSLKNYEREFNATK